MRHAPYACRGLFLLFALLSFGAASCGETIPATEIVVRIDAPESVREEIDALQVRVLGGTGQNVPRSQRLDRTLAGAELSWPIHIVVTPLHDDATRVFEVVTDAFGQRANQGDSHLYRVRAITGFVREETRYLPLSIVPVCRYRFCDEGRTCEGGTCGDAFVPAEGLPTSPPDGGQPDAPQPVGPDDGGAVQGPGDGGGDGGVRDAGVVREEDGPCDIDNGGCDSDAACDASAGSVTCTCPPGYEDPNGDGSFCRPGGCQDGDPACDGICSATDVPGDSDCDERCGKDDAATGPDCDGACGVGDAANSSDCNGACEVGDARMGPDCDEVCGMNDLEGSPDCDEVCDAGETAGSPDCDGACVALESLMGDDCDGDCDAGDSLDGPDCDGVCESSDASDSADCGGGCDENDPEGSPDCDGWCSASDGADGLDCDGDCDGDDAAGSPDCDRVCDVVDAADGPDCQGRCDALDARDGADCDGDCDAGDDAEGPDCDEVCEAPDDDLSPDCDGDCDAGEPRDGSDCDGTCVSGDSASGPDCNGVCETSETWSGADCDGSCDSDDAAQGPDCDGTCDAGEPDDGPDCSIVGTCCSGGSCLCHGDAPDALTSSEGPYAYDSYSIDGTGCVYHPTDARPPFAAVAISDGFSGTGGCGRTHTSDWGPLYASWGIVAMIIETLAGDQPAARATKLLDGVAAFRSGNQTSGSPLFGKLAGRYGVSGFSMGGGGSAYAAQDDPSLLSHVAIMPWGPPQGSELAVPSLVICGSNDTTASCATHGRPLYDGIPASVPKMIATVQSGHLGQPSAGSGASGELGLAFQKLFLEGDERWRSLLVDAPNDASTIE